MAGLQRTNIIKWKCKLCGDIVESDKSITHNMDYCKCEKSFVDAELYYVRYSPNIIEWLNNDK